MSSASADNVRASIRLTLLNTVFAGLFQFGVMTVLTRLLTPTAYGGYAFCIVIASLSPTFVTNVMERVLGSVFI